MRHPSSKPGTTLTRLCGLCLICFCGMMAPGAIAAEKLAVDTIRVIGNERTRPEYILREMTFSPGDSLPQAQLSSILERNRQNIFNLRLFNAVEISVSEENGRLSVSVLVKERWYLFPIPDVGLEERNFYDILQNRNLHRLYYGLSVEWNNISGRNDRIWWYGQLGFSQRMYLQYFRPALFGKRNLDASLAAHYVREPEMMYGAKNGLVQWGYTRGEALRRHHALRIGLHYRLDARRIFYIEPGFYAYRFHDSLFTFNPTYLQEPSTRLSYAALAATFTNDQRDYRAYPLDGWRYMLMFRMAGLPGNTQVAFARLGASWAQYLPVRQRWNFSYGLRVMHSLGNRLPWNEQCFFGYTNSEFSGLNHDLRGYQPYIIAGSTLLTAKAEWKYAIYPLKKVSFPFIPFRKFREFPLGLYLSAFADAGYMHDRFGLEDDFLTGMLLPGYGAGLNLIGFYDNLFRVEYARNRLGQGGIYLHASVAIR